MKNILRLTTILLLALVSGAMAASLVHSADAETIHGILKKIGYKASLGVNGAGVPEISINTKGNQIVYLYFFDDDKRRAGYEGLQLMACSSVSGEVPPEMISYWNQTHRYAKAYGDENGSICIESDLDLSLGLVLDSAMKVFMKKFMQNLDAYELELIGR